MWTSDIQKKADRKLPLWLPNLIFTLVFLGLCFYYSYHITFSQPPQSLHIWRQTNSLSVTQMYYQYNLGFFEGEIQNQLSDDGTSGKTVAELPILYFGIAKLWQLFGKSELLFRCIHLVIIFLGLFSLFRVLVHVLGNAIIAGFISFLIFTSPMMIFYGPNFLPDAPALAFSLIAYYLLLLFVNKRASIYLWFSALFLFLALGLKIIIGTGLIAIILWCLAENLFIRPENRIFKFKFWHYLPFFVALVLAIGWNKYADFYDQLHHGEFSVRDIFPIWRQNSAQILDVYDHLREIFFKEFFYPPLQFITLAIWVFLLFRIRQLPMFMGYLIVIMPLSMAAIVLMWFQVLNGHDYYMISQMPVMVITWTALFMILKEHKFISHPIFLVLLVTVFGFLAYNGALRNRERYQGWMNEWYINKLEALTEMGPFLEQWNIKADDKVISLPDFSINASLYFLNRRGYTDYNNDFSKSDYFDKRISQGAKFLIINDTSILQKPIIQNYTQKLLGQYRNVKVFDLQGLSAK